MAARFESMPTALAGVTVLQRKPIADERGRFERMFCENDLQAILSGRRIVQINVSVSRKRGTVRGMHLQRAPHAELKLIACLRGEIFDVALDVRRGSPTFLRWHGEILTPDNHRTLVVPEGVAHGFQALTEDCELLYLHTAAFQPGSEIGLQPRDPALAIQWPLPIAELSQRDAAHPLLDGQFAGFDT
jgi:dTDP-4-dehydrorhamnose 3,5-epimerase